MLTKKWFLPAAGLLVLIVAVAAIGIVLADSGDGPGREGTAAREAGPNDSSGNDSLGVCVEGVPDCVDTIVCTEGAEGCDIIEEPEGGGGDPDEPVSNVPNSGEGIAPGECSLVHNVEACKEQAVAAAVIDLAARLDIEAEAITVAGVELAEWPDACLGVSAPGIACAQVITPGFLVVLTVDGIDYEYHTDANGTRAVLAE